MDISVYFTNINIHVLATLMKTWNFLGMQTSSPETLLSTSTPTLGDHSSNFCHRNLDVPINELHVCEIMYYILYWSCCFCLTCPRDLLLLLAGIGSSFPCFAVVHCFIRGRQHFEKPILLCWWILFIFAMAFGTYKHTLAYIYMNRVAKL